MHHTTTTVGNNYVSVSDNSLPQNPSSYKLFVNNHNNTHQIETPIIDDTIVVHMREVLLPYHYPSSNTFRHYLLNLVGEYIREEMTLKRFFIELRSLPNPLTHTNGDLYRWLVQLLICTDKDPTCKVMAYLLENGVEETDIEFGSVKRLLSMCHAENQSDKKPKERRVRKSVSRGLRNPPNKWTKEESQRLIQLVNDYGDKSWKKIAEHVGGGKTGAQCAQHWKRVLCPVIRKGSWDDMEELKLFKLVEKYGQSWKNIASEIGTRTDIQCRYQYFKSSMSREVAWLPKEDDLLLKKMKEVKLENREVHWVEVARYIARGRFTKIPRTGLECRTRHELLTTGTTTTAITIQKLREDAKEVSSASPTSSQQQPMTSSSGIMPMSLCASSPHDNLFSGIEEEVNGELDMEDITVPDTLVEPAAAAVDLFV